MTVLRTVCDAAADAGGDVSYEGPETLVLPLRRVAVRRAFANLVGNAVAYGDGARVTLRIEPGQAMVEVADRGPGIPEAELERVFEPFRRLEASRNRATGGVGLGLTIGRRAVEAEGGMLRFQNRSEGGLSAVVALPTAPDAKSPAPRRHLGAATPKTSLSSPRTFDAAKRAS